LSQHAGGDKKFRTESLLFAAKRNGLFVLKQKVDKKFKAY